MPVGENLPPEKKNVRGRPPVCPNRLLAAVCIMMQLDGPAFRDAENAVDGRGLSCNGRVPDHATIAGVFASLPAAMAGSDGGPHRRHVP